MDTNLQPGGTQPDHSEEIYPGTSFAEHRGRNEI